jgi:D-glycero-alpha-D-manno-heptose-7-phosphate kinase
MIISRTPFRVSFSGGGTDLPDFYRLETGAVVSTAINKYMFITVGKRFDHTIRVSYSKTEIVEHVDDIQHPIVREALKHVGLTDSLEIVSIADIPAQAGLGSSSSFTVGLLNALYAYKGQHVTADRLAREACHLEIEVLHEPIGKQDQYIAAFGGLKKIQFRTDESVFVDPIVCPPHRRQLFNDHLAMFYTGKTRTASSILSEQKKETANKRDVLTRMRDYAYDIERVLISDADISDIGRLLHESWQLKRQLTGSISTESIDILYERALRHGALGGKILGAGGGGFLLLFCPPEKMKHVESALGDVRRIDFRFEPEGSKIIYVGA